MRNAIGALQIIALGVILLLYFARFWVEGWILIGEDSTAILTIETILAAGILAFGIERFRAACR